MIETSLRKGASAEQKIQGFFSVPVDHLTAIGETDAALGARAGEDFSAISGQLSPAIDALTERVMASGLIAA